MNHTIIISQAANLAFVSSILVGISNLSAFVNGSEAGSGATDLLIGVCIIAAAAGLFLARSLMQGWNKANPAERRQVKTGVWQSHTHWGLPPHCL
jgi:thiol:disulfide interchange protein